MYFTISNRSKPVPTLLSFLNGLGFFFIFTARFTSISGRNINNYLLYSGFNPKLLAVDPSSLDEWAGVQGFWHSVQSDLKPTPSREHIEPNVSGSPTYGLALSYSIPTLAPLLNEYDLAKLHRRDTSSNVCTISVQTTVYISISDAFTLTLSSIVGPRPTSIPGGTSTSAGTDTTGGESGIGTTGGQGFGNKEGLITGLILVLLILLASLYALCMYFYKKRRNARIQRMSAQPHANTADIVRRLKPSSRRNPERHSQGSELLERKRRIGQIDRGNTAAWSATGNFAAEPDYREKNLGVPPTERRAPDNSIPEIISSPALSSLRLPSSPRPAARLSAGEPGPVDYVPLVAQRVSRNYRPTEWLEALQPIPAEPVRLRSTSDLARDASSQRNSQGKPLSPSAWMAGFGLASGSQVDPLTNPLYVSSSGDHHHFIQSTSKASEPGSPLSNDPSSGSDRTPQGRQASPQRYNHEKLSAVIEPSDVRPDGASDIISTFGSTFGDRPSSHQGVSTTDDDRRLSTTHLVQYHPLSDVEEVLTPVSDERLSMQPGSAPFTSREIRDRDARIFMSPVRHSTEPPLGQLTDFVNPFTDNNSAYPSMPPPSTFRGRRPAPSRRRSQATSLQGEFLPSDNSASISLADTSIVDLGPPIDTGDWDDAVSRRREEDQLFYMHPETAASSRLDSHHTR